MQKKKGIKVYIDLWSGAFFVEALKVLGVKWMEYNNRAYRRRRVWQGLSENRLEDELDKLGYTTDRAREKPPPKQCERDRETSLSLARYTAESGTPGSPIVGPDCLSPHSSTVP